MMLSCIHSGSQSDRVCFLLFFAGFWLVPTSPLKLLFKIQLLLFISVKFSLLKRSCPQKVDVTVRINFHSSHPARVKQQWPTADVATHAAHGAPVVYCHQSNCFSVFKWLCFPSNSPVNLIFLVLAPQLHRSAKCGPLRFFGHNLEKEHYPGKTIRKAQAFQLPPQTQRSEQIKFTKSNITMWEKHIRRTLCTFFCCVARNSLSICCNKSCWIRKYRYEINVKNGLSSAGPVFTLLHY